MSEPRYRLDSDGDVEISIPQPIFEVIRAPELSCWDHAALIEWFREWERYVEKIRHRCTTTGETFENVVSTVKGCLKPKTLKNLATYVLKKPLVSVTDADIMGAVKARCRTLKNEFVPDVTSLFRQMLKMDLSVDDCDARVFRYYEDFNGIVEDNGLHGLIGTGNESDAGYKSRLKARCRILVDNLQPPVLKAQITRLIDLERRDCKTDDVALFDLILEHAKVQQRFHKMSQDYAAKVDSKSPAKLERRPQRPGDVKATPAQAWTPAAPTSAAARHPRPSQPPRSTQLPPHDGCLFCKGSHWLKDCPTATEAQRAAAREKFRENKERRAGGLRSKAARYATRAGSVTINGLLEVSYIPDTGADRSIVPEAVVDSLREVQPTLSPTPLSTPVEAEMADGWRLVCDQELLLDLELKTMAGIVALRSVPCLVLKGTGDELLLGRDVLKGLGIDVEQQLAQLSGPSLLDDEADDFPVGDEIPDPQAAREPTNSLGQLLDRAVENGLPTENTDAVRGLLELFPDIWREAVGSEPPASVNPLQVTLKPDAVPYRSPPRKYAPLQAEFIREYVKSLVSNGLVEQNNSSRWTCAVVPVRKPGTQDRFRLTIDYRPINRMTVPIAGTMPTEAVKVHAFEGQKIYARFDFTQGFWQSSARGLPREFFVRDS